MVGDIYLEPPKKKFASIWFKKLMDTLGTMTIQYREIVTEKLLCVCPEHACQLWHTVIRSANVPSTSCRRIQMVTITSATDVMGTSALRRHMLFPIWPRDDVITTSQANVATTFSKRLFAHWAAPKNILELTSLIYSIKRISYPPSPLWTI